MIRVLIVGAGSYIGTSFAAYVKDIFETETLDAIGLIPESSHFAGFDVVFFVAGITHQKETKENIKLCYSVNRDLAVAVAGKAKEAGVRQFILLSTMAVYGLTEEEIRKSTRPGPVTHYGKSKLQADRAVWKIRDRDFKVAVIRPPMIYGQGCKGKYQLLRKFVLHMPFFPETANRRSMLYIDNLCAFVTDLVQKRRSGLFFPQNAEYVNTADMARAIAGAHGRRIIIIPVFHAILNKVPSRLVKNVFGNLYYEKTDTICISGLKESIIQTEKKTVQTIAVLSNDHNWTYNLRKELLESLIMEGYRVVLILPDGEKVEKLKESGCEFIDVPLFERRNMNLVKEAGLFLHYVSILAKLKPDLMLTFTMKPNLYGGMIAAALHIPYIANVTGLGTATDRGGLSGWLSVRLYRAGLRRAARIFVQNKENGKFLVENRIADNQKIIRIPGSGVSFTRFYVREYPVHKECKFVFISRILREKGIEELLEAAVRIKAKYPDTEFHICGFCEKDYQKRFESLRYREVAVCHGMIDDVGGFLEDMNCIVHPSYYPEGISNVLLEACASGRPAITTDHAGCRDVVEDGVTGLIVPVKDAGALYDSLERFILLPLERKKEMGLSARRKVEQEFDRMIVINAYMKEIRQIAGRDE